MNSRLHFYNDVDAVREAIAQNKQITLPVLFQDLGSKRKCRGRSCQAKKPLLACVRTVRNCYLLASCATA